MLYAMLLFGAEDEVAAMPTDFGATVTVRLPSILGAPLIIERLRLFAWLLPTTTAVVVRTLGGVLVTEAPVLKANFNCSHSQSSTALIWKLRFILRKRCRPLSASSKRSNFARPWWSRSGAAARSSIS